MEMVKRKDLGRLAQEVLKRLPQRGERAALVTLQGDLGAGKTTFVQVLGQELGVEEVIQSPTYVLMKSYRINFGRFFKLVHIDAYRLQTPMEFATLNPEEFLEDPHSLVVLEWPERIIGKLPKSDLTLNFSADGAAPEERYIELV